MTMEHAEFLLKNKGRWAKNTPCYVVNRQKLRENVDLFRNGLAGEILYSYKTNPNEDIAKIIAEKNCGFLISSVEELERLMKTNIVPPERILFQSPSLTDKQLKEIKNLGIRRFGVDSSEQLDLVLDNFINEKVELLVRINTGTEIKKLDLPYGIDTFLGFSLQEAIKVLQKLNSNKNIKLGIHSYLISQNIDLEVWRKNFDAVCDFVSKLKREEIGINVVNLGGGFPVEYQKPVPAMKDIFSLLIRAQNKITALYPKTHFIFEPGRKIVAEAVTLVAKVTHIKNFNGKNVAILDCSLYNSSLDTLIVDLHLRTEKIAETKSRKQKYVIRGSTPDSLDIFARDVELPELKSGDYLAFFNAGAYSFSSDFISLTKPKIVII